MVEATSNLKPQTPLVTGLKLFKLCLFCQSRVSDDGQLVDDVDDARDSNDDDIEGGVCDGDNECVRDGDGDSVREDED